MLTVLYARVSTVDQTTAHQLSQAQAAGFVIDEVFADEGVSGLTTKLRDRPQGRRLFDKLRAGDVLVVRWLDRLGRNYDDVREVVAEFMQRGVIVRTVINDMTFDGSTKDPMAKALRDSMISFLAAMGQAQVEASREAQKAGIAHAKARPDAYLGRKPAFSRAALTRTLEMLQDGRGASEIGREVGLTRHGVNRIRKDPAGAEAALVRWGL